MTQGAPPPTDLRPVARVCGATAIALGSAVIAGWLTGAWILTRVSPDLPAAMPNTALMTIGCGSVLLLETRRVSGAGTRLASTAIAALVAALAGATVVEHAADVTLGIDTRIGDGYGAVAHPGRPASHTAIGLLLLGACLLLSRWRTPAGAAVAGVLCALAAAVVGLAIAGYLVGVHYLYGSDHAHGMSVCTAASFVVLLAGVFALRPEVPPAAWFAGHGAGDAAARRLMLPALVVPFLTGALAQAGANLDLYSERFAVALIVILFAAAIQGLIFLAASTVREREGERQAAEERTRLVVDRIAEAVNIIGPDGHIIHSNDAARAILDDLRQRFDEGPVGQLGWGALDADGKGVANDDLPAEVTRATGRRIDERVLGFPDREGDVRWLRISTRTLSAEGPPFSVVVSFVDVTAQREDATRLTEAQGRFQLAFDHAPIGVCLVALDGEMLQVNRALCEMIGYTEEELLATTFQEINSANEIDDDVIQLRRLVAGEIPAYEMEKRYHHKDGSELWALVSIALVRDKDGKPQHFIGQILDVTERRRLERQLRHHAEHDLLTGLANRRVFGQQVARQLARERRYGGQSSLLMIDLDGFKEINDGMGHAAGDLVLQGVAYLLTARMRDTDLVARLGGDEFAALLPETPREGAEALAIDIVQAVRELSVEVGNNLHATVTASVGVASSDELAEEHDEDALLAAADVAMYEAKRGGRDGHAVHRV
jgi:diguanylate cyclase (GGDEF)-like protein/PAS domain S-box-containing protein